MNRTDEELRCPAAPVRALLAGKWSAAVLLHLPPDTPLRFNELWRTIPRISEKVLAETLDRLERDGFVRRVCYPEVPPRVEYRTTELAESLRPLLEALRDWGRDHLDAIRRSRAEHRRER